MKRTLWAAVAVALLFCSDAAKAGRKFDFSEESWVQFSFLAQLQGTYLDDSGESDFFARRARVILSGQARDGIKFFVETDTPNAGREGTDTTTDIQDAFLDVQLFESGHWIKGGLILLPFSFENRSSAASLLGIDYNVEVIKLVNTFVWRDHGIEFHGNFGKPVSYAVGLFDGYDGKGATTNPDAPLRVTGRVVYSPIGEAQSGWFYSQERRGGDDYLSLGFGIDRQNRANLLALPDEPPETAADLERDAHAWVADLQSGFGLGRRTLTVNAALYDWDNARFDGRTAFVETGLALGRVMPTLKYSTQRPETRNGIHDYTAGVHYFFKDHHIRAGLEMRWGDSEERALAGFQFLF
jgi:hypothetical protein